MLAPTIDITESFPELSKAPISEAVVEFRSAHSTWSGHDGKISIAKQSFPEFQSIEHLRKMVAELEFSQGKSTIHKDEDRGLIGFQMKPSGASKRVLTFNADLASYSEQHPYSGWSEFRTVAGRVWDVYNEIVRPSSLSRIGLRFINRIPLHGPEIAIHELLRTPPVQLSGLPVPFVEFVYSDVLTIPKTGYTIKITRAVVRRDGQQNLIVDIDVACSPGPRSDSAAVIKTLDEMRWLKNKAFFGTITEQAIAQLK